MSAPISLRSKSILMNSAVAVALIYRLWKGAPVAVVVITGVFMYTFVNLVMFFSARKSTPRNG